MTSSAAQIIFVAVDGAAAGMTIKVGTSTAVDGAAGCRCWRPVRPSQGLLCWLLRFTRRRRLSRLPVRKENPDEYEKGGGHRQRRLFHEHNQQQQQLKNKHMKKMKEERMPPVGPLDSRIPQNKQPQKQRRNFGVPDRLPADSTLGWTRRSSNPIATTFITS